MWKHIYVIFKAKSGMSTVEIAIIVAVLVAIALIFRTSIMDFVSSMMQNVFPNAQDLQNSVK